MEGHPERVRDQRIERVVALQPPTEILGELPLTGEQEATILRGRSEIVDILRRDDDRLLVVVGPCSVHDVEAASEYAHRLAELAPELRDDLCLDDARLLREAAHHDGVEGHDQRPAPRRLG